MRNTGEYLSSHEQRAKDYEASKRRWVGSKTGFKVWLANARGGRLGRLCGFHGDSLADGIPADVLWNRFCNEYARRLWHMRERAIRRWRAGACGKHPGSWRRETGEGGAMRRASSPAAYCLLPVAWAASPRRLREETRRKSGSLGLGRRLGTGLRPCHQSRNSMLAENPWRYCSGPQSR